MHIYNILSSGVQGGIYFCGRGKEPTLKIIFELYRVPRIFSSLIIVQLINIISTVIRGIKTISLNRPVEKKTK